MFKIVDTAGLREAGDVLEKEGIRRTRTQIELADLILLLVDQSIAINTKDKAIIKSIQEKHKDKVLIVMNKTDKKQNKQCTAYIKTLKLPQIEVSAKTEHNISTLKDKIISFFSQKYGRYEEEIVVTSRRQLDLLNKAIKSLKNSRQSLLQKTGNEFTAIDLRQALQALGELSGETTTDDILNNIFSKFCIGK